MRIKSILFLLVCFLLSGLTLPATACCEGDPPGNPSCYKCEDGVWVLESWADCGQDSDCTGECHDCYGCTCIDDDTKCDDCYSCVSGSCEWDCDTCYKCESASCVPCKCWDDGGPITGSITVQDAKLCEEVIHTSSISDPDHWSLGGNGDGVPNDTVTYYWIITDEGNNPETGTFTGATDEDTVEWKAPPCIGTVVIKLDADDAPDSMDNPCPDSDRDDPNKPFRGTSTVSLPTGCLSGIKRVTLYVRESNEPSCNDPPGACGETHKPANVLPLIWALYND